MFVLLYNLMLAVQSINFVCTDFWSPYLVQMGAEIRVPVAQPVLASWYVCPSSKLLGNRFFHHGQEGTDTDSKIQTDSHGVHKVRSFRKSLATSTINHASRFCRLQEVLVAALFSFVDRVLRLSAPPPISVHSTLITQILNYPVHSSGFCQSWCQGRSHNFRCTWRTEAQGRSSSTKWLWGLYICKNLGFGILDPMNFPNPRTYLALFQRDRTHLDSAQNDFK